MVVPKGGRGGEGIWLQRVALVCTMGFLSLLFVLIRLLSSSFHQFQVVVCFVARFGENRVGVREEG